MASLARASTALSTSFKPALAPSSRSSGLKSVSFSITGKRFPSISSRPGRFQVSCAAKPETITKVCGIVKKQLALAEDIDVCAGSKFTELGADSLDTVEIVMGLEEAFGITVEEENAQTIATVQDAADLIEDLVAKKSA
ncbi:unnamed protein product [Malus baccata var. baccata]